MVSVTRHPDGVFVASETGEWSISDHTWERYQFLRAELSSVEQAILDSPAAPAEESEEAKALKAAGLSDDEVAIILERRQAAPSEPTEARPVDAVVVPIDKSLSPGQMSAFPEQFPSAAPCPKHRRGVHVPARYMLLEDGTVDALCACGHRLKNVPCPHRNQRLRGKTIVCDWCSTPLIRNATVIEPPRGGIEEGEQPGARDIDPSRWRGVDA